MPFAVVDTSCLIAFERIERPALVPALFSEALMPPAVADEYGGVPDGFALRSLDNPSLARTLCEDLDAGG
jgi:predicted nucleic acid-binding protein